MKATKSVNEELPAIYSDATGKLIPNTDMGKIRYYGTTWNSCTCPDFERIRKDGTTGGSYIDPISKDRCCKHVHWLRATNRTIEAKAPGQPSQITRSIQEQHAIARAAIDRLYGQPVTQQAQPTWSLLNYLELDQPAAPARKEPSAEELFARFI
jgi:hypothetical protein